MSQVTFKGVPIQLNGEFPKQGSKAPNFELVKTDLSVLKLSDLKGKKVIINVFPSVDTSVCALQLKTFSKRLSDHNEVVLLFVSLDLPFALERFCAAEGIKNAITTSDFRNHSFASAYGMKMLDGPLAGLYARATLILDAEHTVSYTQLVEEVTDEPDYDAAIQALG